MAGAMLLHSAIYGENVFGCAAAFKVHKKAAFSALLHLGLYGYRLLVWELQRQRKRRKSSE
jgi:hypothetical protein